MSEKKKDIEQQLTPAEQVKNDWRALADKISYKAIVNNIPYLAFIAVLCVLYITNNHQTIEIQREINDKKKILKELRWRDMDVKSRLIKAKKETEVIYNAEKLGLKPLALPAYKIEADSNDK